jgi:hypothetical protein
MSAQTTQVDDQRWNLLQLRAQEERIVTVFKEFRTEGIEPILFKGWAVARYYPESFRRNLGDVDVAVSRDAYQAAKQLAHSSPLNSILIDVHSEFRQLDTTSWSDLFANSELVALGEITVRVPSREDHLRILATHWLTDGGRFKDKLWDIHYAVESRPSNFDWRRCLEIVEPNRRAWVVCAISIAHRYLGTKVDDLPFASEVDDLPSWVARCVEREWKRPDPLEPLLTSLHDKRLMLRQVARRLPPNPIRATIEADGDIYGSRRWLYQAAVLGRRARPFFRDSISVLRRKLTNRPGKQRE